MGIINSIVGRALEPSSPALRCDAAETRSACSHRAEPTIGR